LEQGTQRGLDAGALHRALKLKPGGCPADDGDATEGFWRLGAFDDKGAGIDVSKLQTDLFLPLSQAQLARRRAAQDLMRQRSLRALALTADASTARTALFDTATPPLKPPDPWPMPPGQTLSTPVSSSPSRFPSTDKAPPRLTVLCRTRAQCDAVLDLADRGLIYELQLDFLEANGLEDAVEAARAVGQRVVVCLPRIIKPGEDRLWRFYRRLRADGLLVRAAGALYQLLNLGSDAKDSVHSCEDTNLSVEMAPEIIGDFSLNATNALTAATFLALPGLTRLVPGHDLSINQICELARGLGAERAAHLEVVAHQHLPIFHTEHCVFCRFLTKGNDYTDCGHPCEKGSLHLRDAAGKDHRVIADMGCRNTIFNAEAQSAARDLKTLSAAGVGFLRLELVDEPPELLGSLIEKYYNVLHDAVGVDVLWSLLRDLPDVNGRAQGVSRGSLDDASWRDREIAQLRPSAAAAAARRR